MNSPDPRLKDLLDERGQGVHVTGDLAERAIARDRANRRRQLTTAVAAGALAVAVAVPIGWNLIGSNRIQVPANPSPTVVSTGPVPTPSLTTGSPKPQTTPTMTARGADGSVIVNPTGGRVTGSSPIAYLVDGEFRDGSRTVRLPDVGTATFVARVADGGILVGGQVDFQSVLFVFDADGTEINRLAAVSRAVVSDDGSHFLASNEAGDLGYYDVTGKQLNHLSSESCDCSVDGAPGGYEAVGLIGTTAYAAERNNQFASVTWDVTGTTTTDVDARITAVNAARQIGLVTPSGLKESEQQCQELWDLRTLRPVWRLCHPLRITTFSGDGSYLLAHGHVDGLGHEWTKPDGTFFYEPVVVIRTDDAAVVLQVASGQSFAMDGSSGKVTVQHSAGQDKSVLSTCTLEGSCEVVAPAVSPNPGPYDPSDLPPYVLSDN